MNPTPEDKDKEYLHHEMLSMTVKQEYLLHTNLQKVYALVLRQCTELLQSKLKQHADWAMLQCNQDVLSLPVSSRKPVPGSTGWHRLRPLR